MMIVGSARRRDSLEQQLFVPGRVAACNTVCSRLKALCEIKFKGCLICLVKNYK